MNSARIAHISPNAPAVDIKLSDGTKVFNNVGYKDITDYACIPVGTYDFMVTLAGTNKVVLTVSDIKLDLDNYYTIY